ncbi:hypothetical protein FRX31_019346 [Thalictrum thalictroides]|uniref:Uncharacterized protein n=1 Tax=Thalictrum thalictroides TaxID=46969 RepID=A0A7J6W283_THATH|nr:hypothetical protein FRX31_019346 [Thalictrum thalictroides]
MKQNNYVEQICISERVMPTESKELKVKSKPNDYWIYEQMVILRAKINKMNCIFYCRLGSPQLFCGPGMDQGLKILENVKLAFHISIVTDVHKSNQGQQETFQY